MIPDENTEARWFAATLVALAKRQLKDQQNLDGAWPLQMEWTQLVGSSMRTFLRLACEDAGVPFHEVLTYLDKFDVNWDNPMIDGGSR
jgi:hypothetical protein